MEIHAYLIHCIILILQDVQMHIKEWETDLPSYNLEDFFLYDSSSPDFWFQAITEVGGVLQFYDSDKRFPAWGFGARPIDGPVSHCFNLNGSTSYCEVTSHEYHFFRYLFTIGFLNFVLFLLRSFMMGFYYLRLKESRGLWWLIQMPFSMYHLPDQLYLDQW